MKNLKSFLTTLGGISAIAAFCLLFIAPISFEIFGVVKEIPYDVVYFGGKLQLSGISVEVIKASTYALVGYILMAIGGLLSLFLAINTRKGSYFLNLLLGILTIALLAVGGILALCTKQNFLAANSIPEQTIDLYKMTTGPIAGGCLGFISAILVALGILLPTKKKRKR